MKRSISVTLVGVLALLGSLLALASGVLLAVSGSSNAAMRAPGAKLGVLFGIAFLVLPSIWGVTTAIGIFFLKRRGPNFDRCFRSFPRARWLLRGTRDSDNANTYGRTDRCKCVRHNPGSDGSVLLFDGCNWFVVGPAV